MESDEWGPPRNPAATGSRNDFFRSALDIVEAAKEDQVQLRLLGATAIYYHCPNSAAIVDAMNRPLTDLDFVAPSKHNHRIENLFARLKFEPNKHVNTLYGAHRQIYYDPASKRQVDVFFDRLSFNHVLDLSKRLDIDPFTISLSDLLLEKLQIVKMSEKDAKDVIVLLREHDVKDGASGDVDTKYVSKLLSGDWGFYYTVSLNIKKIKDYLKGVPFISPEDKALIDKRLDEVMRRAEEEPKSFGWKMRARVGTKTLWYTEAEDVEHRQ